MKRLLRCWLLIACLGAFQTSHAGIGGKAVIAYYSGGPEGLDRYDPAEFTHIIFCFGRLKGPALHLRGMRDTLVIRRMVEMKRRNPRLKVLLSLGGWGGCAPCSEVFADAGNREAFAQSVRALTEYFGTDGIDLDWEYPVISGYPGHRHAPEDRESFTGLVRALRRVLGKRATITFAAGGFTRFLEEAVDWKAVMPMVDYVNLMTYDLVGGYSKRTGHHTPLQSTSTQRESADNCVQGLLRMGVPARQLILGAAFYARVWKDVEEVDEGLYRPGVFKESVGFNAFADRLSERAGYRMRWDSAAMAPFAYHPRERTFATFDDRRSVAEKARYVLRHRLGGIMFWHLGQDTPSDGLLASINAVLRARRKQGPHSNTMVPKRS